MPVEIKELIIRATVTDEQPRGETEDNNLFESGINKSLLIQECVREVLKQLEKSKER